MNNNKNYTVENTTFVINAADVLTDLDRKVLTHLYLPIIGDKALSIFLTLHTMINSNNLETEAINHHQLLKILNLNASIFVEERMKLEAIGLLSVYYQDSLYLYVLKNVLKPDAFFNNSSLVRVLTEILGNDEVSMLAYNFLLKKLDYQSFENITHTFDEVYSLVEETNVSNYQGMGVETINNGIIINDKVFNTEYFILLVDGMNLLKKDILCDANFLEQIKRYAFLYGLSVETLKDVVKYTVKSDGTIDLNDIEYWVKKAYDNRKVKMSFVPKKTIIKTSNKLVNLLNTKSPNDIVKAKTKTELTSSEIAMFDQLLKDTNISLGILNVAILYVLTEKNGEIPAYNFFLKVINTWIRAGITSTEDALSYINNQKTNRNSKYTKPKTIKKVPEWYNEQEQQKPKEEEKTELVDIVDFFKPNE